MIGILNQIARLLRPSGSQIDCIDQLRTHFLRVVKELMQPYLIGFDRSPAQFQRGRSALGPTESSQQKPETILPPG